MKWFFKIFDFYIHSSIHVSLAVVSLTMVTCFYLDIFLDKNLLYFIFFATITGYNFIKYSSLAKLHHLSLTEALKMIQVFSFLSFLAMIYFVIQLPLKVIIACLLLALITALYALPVFSGKRNLRSLSGVKIYVISLVWAGVTVLLPIFIDQQYFTWDIAILFVQRFLFVILITIPFDIRDVKYDHKSIGTIPSKLGVRNSKFLGVILALLIFLLLFLKDEITKIEPWTTLVILISSVGLMLYSKEEQSKYYTSFLIEGIPILWFLIVFLSIEPFL